MPFTCCACLRLTAHERPSMDMSRWLPIMAYYNFWMVGPISTSRGTYLDTGFRLHPGSSDKQGKNSACH